MSKTVSAGVAMFAMLFGAGNVIFLLALGREAGSMVGWAILGFCLTAVLVPLLGLISMMLYDGDYRRFLGRTGLIPGVILTMVCMVLIGPFGAIPRCINIAYSATKWYFPDLPLAYFGAGAVTLIFFLAFKQSSVVELIGKYLGPLKLSLLLAIIVVGILWVQGNPTLVDVSPESLVLKGMTEGYGTMDLLGTIFFSGLIVRSLKRGMEDESDYKAIAFEGLKAGSIGALLLGLVYTGFCLVASFHGPSVADVNRYELLNALAPYILGPQGGMLTNAAVAVSCVVTALALTTVLAEYLHKTIFRGRIGYIPALAVTTVLSGLMTNLGFMQIMTLIVPIVVACYPALIMLAFTNLGYKLFGFPYVKAPVFITLAITIFFMLR
ncbi:MAG: branched-chain amino acid transport system II carrier protein [Deltaproteobacteria bacterium]|nr:branched-chain amino acid transport system II carrier protein [Deltaproteobacteria bacterium]